MADESSFGASYVGAMRAHFWVVLLVIAAAVGASVAYLSSSSPSYKATARLLVNPINAQDAPQLDLPLVRDTGDPVRDVQTAASLVGSHHADALAAKRLGRGWTAAKAKAAIDVRPEGQTSIIDITATARTPALAARLANTYVGSVMAVRRAAFRSVATPALTAAQAQLRRAPDPNGVAAVALQRQVSELQAMSQGIDPNLSRAEAAAPSGSALGPPDWLVVLLALLAGVLLASGTALLLESVGPQRIGSEDELVAVLPLPILARLPLVRRANGRRSMRAARPDPLVREAFRTVRVQLEIANSRPRALMITSPTRRDGKTTTAIGLASELASNGARVILVDADLRKPQLRRSLGLGAEPPEPIVDVESAYTLEDRLEAVPGIEGLKLLALDGFGTFESPRVMATAMSALIEEAIASADFVVVDTAPLGEVSDALTLVGAVDQVLIVARLNNTRRTSLEVLRDLLERSNVGPAGYIVMGSTDAIRSYPYPRGARVRPHVRERA